MKFLRLSTLSLTIVLFTLGGLISPENTTLAEHCKGKHKDDMGCDGGGGGDSGGGGKALLFEIDDVLICGGPTDPLGASFGQVSWSGNVLWDPEFIHVHFKLQLKDVDPATYDIFGNHDMTSAMIETGCSAGTPDFPLCSGGVCDLEIIVKQNQQGRTSGALRLPGNDPDDPTTVWVTVPVRINGVNKFLRSTPVTVVLPPNEVGCGTTACPE